MINDLLTAMSTDMKISPYKNESEESFIYRLCYSALGQWCLNAGQNRTGNEIGTTKHNQTIILNELLSRYKELFPQVSNYFVKTYSPPTELSVFIRRVYEETGFLLTNENSQNRIANFGRSIRIGNEALFFGLPNEILSVNGLGVYSVPSTYEVSVSDFLIRDSLTCEEYFNVHYDPIDFYRRDIDIQELEFFNPLANSSPSNSWSKSPVSDCTVARKFETGSFFRIMKMQDCYFFADETIEPQSDSFTSYEYRRLYFALKNHYQCPLSIQITKIDEEYSRLHIGGCLPNREYYFLLLLSWPEHSAFDRVNFIIKTKFLKEIISMLEHIGLKLKGGYIHE